MYNVSRSQFTGPGSGASLVQVAQLVCQHQSFLNWFNLLSTIAYIKLSFP